MRRALRIAHRAQGTAPGEQGEVVIASSTTAEGVRGTIEGMLTIGDLKPGQKLNEFALASRLGVGRALVRDVIRTLEHEGLVVTRPNQGAFVSRVDLDAALEIYDTNAVLFGFAAHELAGRASSGQALALVRQVEAMDAAVAAEDATAYSDLNLAFHAAVFAFAGNGHAARIYGVAARRLALLRARTFGTAPNMRASNDEHRAIIDAIVKKQPDAARRLAEDHGLNGRRRFLLANAGEDAAGDARAG